MRTEVSGRSWPLLGKSEGGKKVTMLEKQKYNMFDDSAFLFMSTSVMETPKTDNLCVQPVINMQKRSGFVM